MSFNYDGPDALKDATEQQLLKHIKSVAVKSAKATSHFQPIEASNLGQITPIKPAYQRNKLSWKLILPNNRNYKSHAEKCKGCWYNIHLSGRKGKSYYKCGEENHFSSVCRNTTSSNCIKENKCSHGQDESISFITTVNTQPLAMTRWRKRNPTWRLERQPIYTWKTRTTAIHWCKGHLKCNCPQKIRTFN